MSKDSFTSRAQSSAMIGHIADRRAPRCYDVSREVFSAFITLVVATSFIMFSMRSAADVGSVVLQLTLSALLCTLLPALLVCKHGPSKGSAIFALDAYVGVVA